MGFDCHKYCRDVQSKLTWGLIVTNLVAINVQSKLTLQRDLNIFMIKRSRSVVMRTWARTSDIIIVTQQVTHFFGKYFCFGTWAKCLLVYDMHTYIRGQSMKSSSGSVNTYFASWKSIWRNTKGKQISKWLFKCLLLQSGITNARNVQSL